METRAFLNGIGTAVPAHDVHAAYLRYATTVLGNTRDGRSFARLAARAQIDHRYSVVPFAFYEDGLPDTRTRMRTYGTSGVDLAERALEALGIERARSATHLIVTTCTGFYAPGIDIGVIARCGLDPGIERTIVGFMGCYAALCGFKLARHVVRSDPRARVLVLNLELCSLHLQRPLGIEDALGFSIFGDGCAASFVSAEAAGLELEAFGTMLIPESSDDITWHIGGLGFEMRLSLEVPKKIERALGLDPRAVSGGVLPGAIDVWAVHPGGRAVLDAVQGSLALAGDALARSRDVLRSFGNMSSATVVFVLEQILRDGVTGSGCALAFGPGMICETMRFSCA